MQITCLGAAGEVTGSQHLIETENVRLLLDCGLFQGRRADTYSKNAKFFCRPRDLDGVVLSHGHIDHCGNLPGLYKAGYRGPIFCTPATADVAAIMLKDSARIQEEDAAYLKRHRDDKAPPIEPLYTERDAKEVIDRFETLDYDEWHELSPELRLRFSDAGHILGSAITELDLEEDGQWKRVAFTGDLGRRNLPILRDPRPIERCDVLITESTYGNRVHEPTQDLREHLLRIFNDAVHRGGRVVIPAFSLGRTQNLIYFLNELTEARLLPEIPVYVDSPLSMRLTDVYRRHEDIMDADARRMLHIDDDLFGFPKLRFLRTPQESQQLNYHKGPFAVIAASGMCENGRVRHHLKHALSRDDSIIAVVGFQAQHTLGRRLVDGDQTVRLFGRDIPVRARIEKLNGLSAHADAEDFKWWFDQLNDAGGIGQAIIVHGEQSAARSLAELLQDCCDEPPIIAERRKTYTI